MFRALLCATVLLSLFSCCLSAGETVKPEEATCDFTFKIGGWRPLDWMLVKSPRWSNTGEIRQESDYIANVTPAGASEEDMLSRRAPETYASMLWKTRLSGSFTVSSTMAFDYRMAPLIVLTAKTGTDANGYPEYREHWEVVLWDEGINIWHHEFKAGRPVWHRAAMIQHKFLAGEKYDLKVQVTRRDRGAELKVTCGDACLAYIEHDLPESLMVGLTGCEGVNRFYDFKVTRP